MSKCKRLTEWSDDLIGKEVVSLHDYITGEKFIVTGLVCKLPSPRIYVNNSKRGYLLSHFALELGQESESLSFPTSNNFTVNEGTDKINITKNKKSSLKIYEKDNAWWAEKDGYILCARKTGAITNPLVSIQGAWLQGYDIVVRDLEGKHFAACNIPSTLESLGLPHIINSDTYWQKLRDLKARMDEEKVKKVTCCFTNCFKEAIWRHEDSLEHIYCSQCMRTRVSKASQLSLHLMNPLEICILQELEGARTQLSEHCQSDDCSVFNGTDKINWGKPGEWVKHGDGKPNYSCHGSCYTKEAPYFYHNEKLGGKYDLCPLCYSKYVALVPNQEQSDHNDLSGLQGSLTENEKDFTVNSVVGALNEMGKTIPTPTSNPYGVNAMSLGYDQQGEYPVPLQRRSSYPAIASSYDAINHTLNGIPCKKVHEKEVKEEANLDLAKLYKEDKKFRELCGQIARASSKGISEIICAFEQILISVTKNFSMYSGAALEIFNYFKEDVEVTHSAKLQFPDKDGNPGEIIEIPPPEGEWIATNMFISKSNQWLPRSKFVDCHEYKIKLWLDGQNKGFEIIHKNGLINAKEYLRRSCNEFPNVLSLIQHVRKRILDEVIPVETYSNILPDLLPEKLLAKPRSQYWVEDHKLIWEKEDTSATYPNADERPPEKPWSGVWLKGHAPKIEKL